MSAFHFGCAARRVRAAAPQRKHQFCSGRSGESHSGQTSRGGASACAAGVAGALTRSRPRAGAAGSGLVHPPVSPLGTCARRPRGERPILPRPAGQLVSAEGPRESLWLDSGFRQASSWAPVSSRALVSWPPLSSRAPASQAPVSSRAPVSWPSLELTVAILPTVPIPYVRPIPVARQRPSGKRQPAVRPALGVADGPGGPRGRLRSAGRRWCQRQARNQDRSGRCYRGSRHSAGRPRCPLRAAPSPVCGRAAVLPARAPRRRSDAVSRALRAQAGRCAGQSGAGRTRGRPGRDRQARALCARSVRVDASVPARQSPGPVASPRRVARLGGWAALR